MAADLLVYGGPILTMDPARPSAEAMAVQDGRVLAVGNLDELASHAGPGTQRLDLRGNTAMPGLIDFHIHLLTGALGRLFEVGLQPGLDFAGVLDAVQAAAARPKPREWVVAGTFGPTTLAAMQQPGALAALDAVSHGRPVLLSHVSLHCGFANTKAMQLAGVTSATPDPPHGTIVRAANNAPTGMLQESAVLLIQRAIPAFTMAERIAAARHGVAMLNGLGITGFLDANATPDMMRAFRALDDDGDLTCWAGFCLATSEVGTGGTSIGDLDAVIAGRHALCGPHMVAETGKIFLDGVPSLHTAAMLHPYAEVPHTGGDTLLSQTELTRQIALFERHGMSVKVHAIGDRAIRMVLDAVEEVRALKGPDGPQHQIAHLNFIQDTDIPRLAALNVIADLNPPLWFPAPANMAHERAVGPARFAKAWPIRSLLEAGVTATAGTDWPAVVDVPNPWIGLAGMITRRNPLGLVPGVQRPEQAIGLNSALPLFTRNPAWAMRLGDRTGMLAPGLSADFIVLDHDLGAIPPIEIAQIQVLGTYFAGRLVYGEASF